MPKEHKKRGRRDDQKKRKRDGDGDAAAKRHKADDDEQHVQQSEPAQLQHAAADEVTRPGEMQFYGMLDDDEQEYFKRADEMLELNQFETPGERTLFLESVYKEADGKELKIANSQSCSRLLERLILLSTPAQLKNLFQKFSGQQVLPMHLPSRSHANPSQLPQPRPAPIRFPRLRSPLPPGRPRRHPGVRKGRASADPAVVRS